jgi:hypothetical protein
LQRVIHQFFQQIQGLWLGWQCGSRRLDERTKVATNSLVDDPGIGKRPIEMIANGGMRGEFPARLSSARCNWSK